MPSGILLTSDQRTGIITLDRPEQRNALNDVLIRTLTDSIISYSKNSDIRVIVITGSGDSFCSGMDIGYIQESALKAHDENVEDAKNLLRLYLAIQSAKKPVIAMVNGPAMGGGCGLAVACDYVFASEAKAKFGVPEVKLGFVPAVILQFLIKRMGEGKTREFALQGEIADSAKAKAYGLATEVIPDDNLYAYVLEFSEKLASGTSPSSIALTKELFVRLSEMNYRDGLDFASNVNAMVRKTEDFRKGMESFLKKEKLKW